ncbi:MAG: 3-dehydroquinate synthase II [Candidatus Hydrothermarchaeales archaeon]
MKFFWVDCSQGETWAERKNLLTAALESGAKGALMREDDLERASKLGEIDMIVPWKEDMDNTKLAAEGTIVMVGVKGEGDGTIELGNIEDSADLAKLKELKVRTCGYVEIRSKAHERLAALEARVCDYLLVVGKDWTIIPLENLIAELQKEDVKVMAGVKDSEDAKLALETLEVGVDGVLLQTTDVNEIKKVSGLLVSAGKVQLVPARITKLQQVGMGDRVCVDTASLLKIGEGMLVGSQASGLFLVHSETLETEYVASRPFRVNAGAVHAYILGKDAKTRYLSEISAGDELLVVDSTGNTRTVVVGRVKIEKRPLMLVEAEHEGNKYKTLLQNAETITLVNQKGKPVSITSLKEGDEVLLQALSAGRHFGMEVEESVIER